MPDGHSPERRPAVSPLAKTRGQAPALLYPTATPPRAPATAPDLTARVS